MSFFFHYVVCYNTPCMNIAIIVTLIVGLANVFVNFFKKPIDAMWEKRLNEEPLRKRERKLKTLRFLDVLFSYVLPIAGIIYFTLFMKFDKGYVVVVLFNTGSIIMNYMLALSSNEKRRRAVEILKLRTEIANDKVEVRDMIITIKKDIVFWSESITELAKVDTYLLEQEIVRNKEKVAVSQIEKAKLAEEKAELEAKLEYLKEIEKNRPRIIRKL